MITVAIMINGNTILARSATRVEDGEDGVHTYQCDDGTLIKHQEENGAVALCHQLLKTIKEVK